MKERFLFLLVFTCILLSSCKKYEDGPLVSIRSKTDRLSNFWMVDSYTVDGEDSTNKYIDFTWRFGKDQSFDFFGTLNGARWARTGIWEFTGNHAFIGMMNLASDSLYEFEIMKLKERKLWFSQVDPRTGSYREWHLKKRDLPN